MKEATQSSVVKQSAPTAAEQVIHVEISAIVREKRSARCIESLEGERCVANLGSSTSKPCISTTKPDEAVLRQLVQRLRG